MRKVRTLVVDDEPLARLRITNLLRNVPYIDLLGECKNGKEALDSIQRYRPDLIFLDIQMPDINGMELAQQKNLKEKPFIIFVTAFDEYALKAFDVQAIDYLLKPYDDDRFMRALENAAKHIHLKDKAILHEKMVHILHQFEHSHEEDASVIEIKDKGRKILIAHQDILWLEADGNYIRVNTLSGLHLHRSTLHELESKLDPDFFLRIHRSILVNTHQVQSIRYTGNNQYTLTFHSQQKIQSSRSYKEAIDTYITEKELKRKFDS
jgi:two-component system LytT family response regulator